jgi:hypothetical protein
MAAAVFSIVVMLLNLMLRFEFNTAPKARRLPLLARRHV